MMFLASSLRIFNLNTMIPIAAKMPSLSLTPKSSILLFVNYI